MRIEINPRSLLNLEHICEVLYKLHPSVLDYLVDMQRNLGSILGLNKPKNMTLEAKELLASILPGGIELPNETEKTNEPNETEKTNEPNETEKTNKNELLSTIQNLEEKANSECFYELKRYLQLDTYEYIPIQIYIEVEDPVIGRKVKELIRSLEKTTAPEQFLFNKREIDEDAYFGEGYNLTLNKEQKKQINDFLNGRDVKSLRKLLVKEKLYP